MTIALCKCGFDLIDHPDEDFLEEFSEAVQESPDVHVFDAAGTKYRCGEKIEMLLYLHDGPYRSIYFCPRPAYHKQEGVECGPLTGEKLW